MRYHYQAEPDLQITPIEKIRLPLRSRDELPPIPAGLQSLWMHPTLRAEFLGLLEAALHSLTAVLDVSRRFRK